MQIVESFDIPIVVADERRHRPDRRVVWRGGRRDDDWTHRPLDAWRQLEAHRPTSWRQWLSKIVTASAPTSS